MRPSVPAAFGGVSKMEVEDWRLAFKQTLDVDLESGLDSQLRVVVFL